jgi:hypothetical protein
MLRLTGVGGDEAHAEALAAPALEVGHEAVELARIRIDRQRLERDVRVVGGQDFELEPRPPRDDVAEGSTTRRVFGRLVEQARRVHDHRRAGGYVL